MKLAEAQERSSAVMKTLISKSWEDEAFKREFIASPVKTIEKTTGKPNHLPAGMTVLVEDQTNPSIIYLNIPAKPDYSNIELTDEQLEVIAGGEIGIALGIGIGLAALGGGIAVGYYFF
jgi:hypothetical protein